MVVVVNGDNYKRCNDKGTSMIEDVTKEKGKAFTRLWRARHAIENPQGRDLQPEILAQ